MSPEVAKHYIEAYYKKLEARLSQLEKLEPSKKKSKKKAALPKRTVSFNQNDFPQNKLTSDLRSRHSRRMSVDVDLLLGQSKGLSSKKLLTRTSSARVKHSESHSNYQTDLEAAATVHYKNPSQS